VDILAVGDIVNGIGLAGLAFSFQPAVSVSIMISSVGSWNDKFCDLNDGVKNSRLWKISSDAAGATSGNNKLFINNTNYLHISAPNGGEFAGYSGIQVQ